MAWVLLRNPKNLDLIIVRSLLIFSFLLSSLASLFLIHFLLFFPFCLSLPKNENETRLDEDPNLLLNSSLDVTNKFLSLLITPHLPDFDKESLLWPNTRTNMNNIQLFYFSYFRLRWGSDILVSYLSLPNNLKKKCKKNHKNIILNFFKQS